MICDTYTEISNGNLKVHCFKQWPALKMRVRYGTSIVLLLTSYVRHFRDTCDWELDLVL